MYEAATALFNRIKDFRTMVLGHESLVSDLQIAVIDNTINHPTFKLTKIFREFDKFDHYLFNKEHGSIISEDVEKAKHCYLSVDQTPENQRNFNYAITTHNIEDLAHIILSGNYLALLPIHYAQQWLDKTMIRSILPDVYAFQSEYEIIRRCGASRTLPEIKFFDLIKSFPRN